MATYFKYAERSLDSQVNWEELGSGISDFLLDEKEAREEARQKIDDQARQDAVTLANAPQGEDKTQNEWALRFASQAQEVRLMQERLLKNGSLKPRDYTIMRQNLMDGTTQAFTLLNATQKFYSEAMERYHKGDSSYIEQWNLAMAEGFANFSNSGLYIDPLTGRVSVAMRKVGKDGVMGIDLDKDNVVPINALQEMLTTKVDKFKVEETLQSATESMGTYIKETGLAKGLDRVEDIMQHPDYKAMEDNLLNSLLANPISSASVLLDYVKFQADGTKYDLTRDPAKAKENGNLILQERSETGKITPRLTEEQMGVAREALRSRFRTMQIHKEAATEPQRGSASDYEYYRKVKQQKAEDDEAISMLGALYSGTEADMQAAAQYFAGLDPSIQKITRDDNGVTIIDANGNKYPIAFTAGGAYMPFDRWVKSATKLSKLANTAEAVKRAGTTNFTFRKGKASYMVTNVGKQKTDVVPLNKAMMANPDGKGVIYLDQEFRNSLSSGRRKGYQVNAEATELLFSRGLPSGAKKGMVVKGVTPSGLSKATSIYLPAVMDKPVVIPINGSSEMVNALIRIVTTIYDAAASGVPVSVEKDLRSLFPSAGVYSRYNGGRDKQVDASGY